MTYLELIKIRQTENGTQTVLATDLYIFLEPKTKYNVWIKRMLEYGFVEGIDFHSFLSESIGGRPTKEYILTVECAKAIAMVQRSEKGRQIRAYFIEVEKHYKEIATPQQIAELYNRLTVLEQKQINYTNDWSIDRYLRVNGLYQDMSIAERQQLGKQCTKAFRTLNGMPPKKVPHPSYTGGQNVYPYELINKIYTLKIQRL